MPKYRILAIDGGGVRGLLTAMLLERLCKQPGLQHVFDRVDLVAGNSSGSFIALAMAHGLDRPSTLHTLGAIRTAFETPRKVFGRPRTGIDLPRPLDLIPWLLATKYGRKARERAAKKLFDDVRLRDLKKNVLITAFELDNSRHAKGNPPAVKNWKPKIFHNFKGPGSDEDLLARMVVLDSTAAITYFPDADGYVDGGVYANNPSMCALAQIFDDRYPPRPKPDFEDVLLFSVGAGQSLTPVRPRFRFGWGIFRWLWNGRIFSLMTDATVGVAHYQCLQMLGQDNYHRLDTNFPEGKVIELDAFGDVGFLQSHVDGPEVSREIEQCAQWLRQHWMPGLESPLVVREVTSKHIGPSTELTCLMPIRQGFLPVLDTRTYATRLGVVFKVLQRLRTASREVKQIKPILDIVEAARTVHAFSWSIIQGRQLLLSVSFDRPWEPYIRVIWRDLGPLLDLFLCNCEGFVPSTEPFEAFAGFVRRHQVEANFYYPASSLTIDDQRYLVGLEKSQRDNPDGFRKASVTFAAADPAGQAVSEREASEASLREARTQWLTVLKTLYDLRDLFPKEADHVYLQRAAAKLLGTSRPGDTDDGSEAVAWFEEALASLKSPPPKTRTLDQANIQGGILQSHKRATHGCLLLARIEDQARARSFIGRLVDFTEGQAEGAWRVSRATDAWGRDVRLNVAFTLGGLRELGVKESDLRRFPKEFREGMEARAGLLGDVRENHPENWTLPSWNVKLTGGGNAGAVVVKFADGPGERPFPLPPIRPSTVDVVIALYKAEDGDAEGRHGWTPKNPLYRTVEDFCASALTSGIRVVSAQPMYRLTRTPGQTATSTKKECPPPVDHFGFVDGLSQPRVSDSPKQRDDVATGELIVGFQNERHDPPFPDRSADPLEWTRGSLLDCGTFLVVRKLREHVARLNKALVGCPMAPEDIGAKMMGRTCNGTPLVKKPPHDPAGKLTNDFTFKDDRDGAMCPLHSHIRRANPRLDKRPDGAIPPHVPRIARRSLAYGPPFCGIDDADRGIVFMAYNASIAEQFETLQRWMSGGNTPSADGIRVYSGQPDPFLGLPDADGKRTYRFMDGKTKPISVDLGKPFVTLQWGLYLFVPSISGLALLSKEPECETTMPSVFVAQGERILPSLTTLADWTAVLEDISSSQLGTTSAVLAAIQATRGGILRTPYGVIVASRDLVMQVLRSDPDFSVSEYQRRFGASVGESYLGMDRGPDYVAASAGPNRALQEVKEDDAFAEAYRFTKQAIDEARAADSQLSKERREDDRFIILPLEPVVDKVIGRLAYAWFDIPDGDLIKMGGRPVKDDDVHCPFSFLAPSRYVFSSPNPRDTVRNQGEGNGRHLLDAVRRFVDEHRERERNGGDAGLHGRISRALFREIRDDNDLLARMLLGLAFGFAPTVYGNAVAVLSSWIGDETLWRVQQRLRATGESRSYEAAFNVLRKDLVRAMLSRPVPPLLHRTVTVPRTLGGLALNKGERVVLCMSGVTQEMLARGESNDVTVVFGGNRDAEPHPTHACPGYHIAMGSLLGLLSAVLHAGTLAPGAALTTVKLARTEAASAAAS